MAWSERLSGLDAMFLYIEDHAAHMHVGAVAVFEGTPPTYAELQRLLGARLDRAPRYRQRVVFPPYNLGRPVWVDHDRFDLQYHLRHTALPAPGGEAALKTLAGRVFSQRLDRDRPLWELWLVEGLGEGRFALISKAHHCMLDGVAGADLATALLGTDPDPTLPPEPPPWVPRPAPGKAALLAEALGDQVRDPARVLRSAWHPEEPARAVLEELGSGVLPMLGLSTLGRAPPSSLNCPIGPHRRWEMVALQLPAVKAVGAALGGTVNDVLMTVVAGALRTLLAHRGEEAPEGLRAMVPVSVRAPGAAGALGNRVTAVFCPLPVGQPDPRARLGQVAAEMKRLKANGQALGARAWARLGDFAPPALLSEVTRFQSAFRYMNLVVTNIPGPREAIYLLGRKMVGYYPLVPLAPEQTLGVAIQSYHGTVGIGLLGDSEAMRDLPVVAGGVAKAFDELAALAAVPRGG